jgi:hypothetical protein
MEKNKVLYLTLVGAFVYEFILALQGFDLCDEGLVLSSYQHVFHTPSSLSLSAVIGGIWNLLFGFGGILSFRILNVITIIFTIYFTYLSVKDYVKPIIIPIATSLALLLNDYGILVFHHNYLTALLVAISVLFILNGLNKKSYLSLFWGAFFCGVNIFTRLPNVTMIALGLLLFVNYFYEKDAKRLRKYILYSLMGLCSGIGLILLILFFCGQLKFYQLSIIDTFSLSTDNTHSSHNGLHLIKVYASNYKHIYISCSIFAFSTISIAFILNLIKNKGLKSILVILYAGIIGYFLLYQFNSETYYALLLLPLLLSYYVDIKNKSIILLNSASLIIMFLLPLGSDFGVRNMGSNCIWLGTFVAIFHVYRFINDQIQQKKNDAYLILLLVLYILYIGHGLYMVSRNAYFDSGSRFEKCYQANNSKFTVYTSEPKAKAIDELLAALDPFVQKNDYLFAFESLPMIHYLTETKPYLGNLWPWTLMPSNFNRRLEKAVVSKLLPVVLREKFHPIGGNWILSTSTNNNYYNKERMNLFEKFLIENNYQVAWENKLFVIYVSEQSK